MCILWICPYLYIHSSGGCSAPTLCNACGVWFKSGRLFPEYRLINSPTFSLLLHSNSHCRVLVMRRHVDDEAAAGGTGADAPSASPRESDGNARRRQVVAVFLADRCTPGV
jgi:hypothetical protein